MLQELEQHPWSSPPFTNFSLAGAFIATVEERATITADGMYNGPGGSVVSLPDGDYLLGYSKGTTHTNTTNIVFRRSTDKGVSWSSETAYPVYATPIPRYLARTSGGKVFGVDNTSPGVAGYTRSADGVTWAGYTNSSAWFVTLPVLDGADMYEVSYHTTTPSGNTADLWKSSDDGLTWTFVSTLRSGADAGVNETGIIKIGTNGLMAVSRSDSGTATYVKLSGDMGVTWGPQLDYTSQLGVLNLPQLLNVGKGILLLGRGSGNTLVGFTTNDNGVTFVGRTVLDTYTGTSIDGGYCWPLLLADGRVFVSYYADSNGLQKPDIKSLKIRFA